MVYPKRWNDEDSRRLRRCRLFEGDVCFWYNRKNAGGGRIYQSAGVVGVGTRVALHVRARRVGAAPNIGCLQTTLSSLNKVRYTSCFVCADGLYMTTHLHEQPMGHHRAE